MRKTVIAGSPMSSKKISFAFRQITPSTWVVAINIKGYIPKKEDFLAYGFLNRKGDIAKYKLPEEAGFVLVKTKKLPDGKKYAEPLEIIVATRLREKGLASALYAETLRIAKTKKLQGLTSMEPTRTTSGNLFWEKHSQKQIKEKDGSRTVFIWDVITDL
jgi:hypothetical protein